MSMPRTHEVDIIRLIALLGICIANIPTMGILSGGLVEVANPPHDEYANFVRAMLVEGKFMLLFSFVFGWGLAIQQKRITEAGGNFKNYYFRRAFGLILLGIIHMAFIYGGDILVTYGIICLVFWFTRDFASRTPIRPYLVVMLRWLLLSIVLSAIFAAAIFFVLDEAGFPSFSNESLGGSFYEATLYRLKEGGTVVVIAFCILLFQDLAAFGLGYTAANTGFFVGNSSGFLTLQKALPKLLLVGILCNLPYAIIVSEMSESAWLLPGLLLWLIGAPALSAVYLYCIIAMARRIQIPEILTLAGRNSLSVYVLQGLIASLMFGGYGLGWFDQFGEFMLIPISIGIYVASVLVVGLYAKQFGRGFLEPILRWISGSSVKSMRSR